MGLRGGCQKQEKGKNNLTPAAQGHGGEGTERVRRALGTDWHEAGGVSLKLAWLGCGRLGCHPQEQRRWQEVQWPPGSCPGFPEITGSAFIPCALVCSAQQGGYFSGSYLDTQAEFMSLKGLAAGEAAGGGVVQKGPEGFENR